MRSALLSAAPLAVLALATAPVALAQSGLVSRGPVVFDSRWSDESFVAIGAGGSRTIAGRGDGTFVMWGGNYFGECAVPRLPAGLHYVEMATADGLSLALFELAGHSLARRSDGSVVAWGNNERGQCDVPPLPAGHVYRDVAAGSLHALAVRNDGAVLAWGSNDFGQCDVPPLPAGLRYLAVSAGYGHSAALRSDGALVAWGLNTQGQCNAPPPPAGVPFVEASAGEGHTLALGSDGSVVGFGANGDGQCDVPTPPAGLRFVSVAAGWRHSVGLLEDGRILVWGNTTGGLADVPALPTGVRYTRIASSSDHAVALRSDGRVVAWGSDESCQLNVPALPGGLAYTDYCGSNLALRSDGSLVTWGHDPDPVPELPPGVKYLGASRTLHTLALRSDGAVVAWGWNPFGQCDVPPLPSGLAYVRVAAGLLCSLAIRSDGSLVVWGDDQSGQQAVPPLPAGVRYVEVDANGDWSGYPDQFCMALRSDGEVVGWGSCTWGQCNVPPLPPGVAYVQIAAGMSHAIARRSDGEVVAWGNNSDGQCDVPPLPAGTSYVDIAAGAFHGAALRSDGTVVSWGDVSFSIGPRYLPALGDELDYVDVDGDGVGRFEGCGTCYPGFCAGDRGEESVVCPCGNFGEAGRGCDNSASTGGARLTVRGAVEPDRVVLGATGMIPSSLCIFLQGKALLGSPRPFGDGVRCVGGELVKLGARSAASGSARFPGSGDPSISTRSAALGDLIRPGTFRYYQAYYRDSDPSFCGAPPATFNASNAVMVRW